MGDYGRYGFRKQSLTKEFKLIFQMKDVRNQKRQREQIIGNDGNIN